MKRYSRIILTTLVTALLLMSGFNGLVDPYDATRLVSIDGLNARKTRSHEDGRRVLVSHQLLKRPEHSIIIGTSRVVDGFPETTDAWPGGLYNAGMRGSSDYERAHLTALALKKENLRCVIVSFTPYLNDYDARYKSAFLISRLPDGNAPLSMGRMLLSPNTLARSVQTVRDNITGGSDSFPFSDTYPTGQQRDWFLKSPESVYRAARDPIQFEGDLDLYFMPLEALASRGVQIIGFFSPTHAYMEEAAIRTQWDNHIKIKQAVAERFEALSKHKPNKPCTPDQASVLWDFTGFQPFSTTALPRENQTNTHPLFHEPAHYREIVGLNILRRMLGLNPDMPEPFGLKLTPENVNETARETQTRRTAYITTEEGLTLNKILLGTEAKYDNTPHTRRVPPNQTEEKQIKNLIKKGLAAH